jgi:bifunctional DNA-binding transcriptional regulator/antitoxin component of YhaV-PrlF toxin-antitoxin module
MSNLVQEYPDALLAENGSLTLPEQVREQLHARAGDRVRFGLSADGNVVMLAVRPLDEMMGRLESLRSQIRSQITRTLSLEEIEQGISDGLAEKFRPEDK